MANKVSTEIVSATRLGSTVYGNPMWMLHTANGDYRVSNDSAVSYAVNNYVGLPVTLTLTRAGRVENIRTREV